MFIIKSHSPISFGAMAFFLAVSSESSSLVFFVIAQANLSSTYRTIGQIKLRIQNSIFKPFKLIVSRERFPAACTCY